MDQDSGPAGESAGPGAPAGAGGDVVLGALAAIRTAISDPNTAGLWSRTDADSRDGVREGFAVLQSLESEWLGLVSDLDTRPEAVPGAQSGQVAATFLKSALLRAAPRPSPTCAPPTPSPPTATPHTLIHLPRLGPDHDRRHALGPPPRWIDPLRRLIRNTLHHRADQARGLGTQLRLVLPPDPHETPPWLQPPPEQPADQTPAQAVDQELERDQPPEANTG